MDPDRQPVNPGQYHDINEAALQQPSLFPSLHQAGLPELPTSFWPEPTSLSTNSSSQDHTDVPHSHGTIYYDTPTAFPTATQDTFVTTVSGLQQYEPCQELVIFSGQNPTQRLQPTDQTLLNLSEDEIQLIRDRRRLLDLERNQTSTFYPQHIQANVYNNSNVFMHTEADISNLGENPCPDVSNVPTAPIMDGGGTNVYGFNANGQHNQMPLHATSNQFSLNSHAQGPTSFDHTDLQLLDSNSSDIHQPGDTGQLNTESMFGPSLPYNFPLPEQYPPEQQSIDENLGIPAFSGTLSQPLSLLGDTFPSVDASATPISFSMVPGIESESSLLEQQSTVKYLETPAYSSSVSQPLSLLGDAFHSIDISAMPTSDIMRPGSDFITSSYLQSPGLLSHHEVVTNQPFLPSSVGTQLDTPDVDGLHPMTLSIRSTQHTAVPAKVGRKRARESGDTDQISSTLQATPDKPLATNLNLDRQVVYRGPIDDLEAKKREKRPRQFNGKAAWACFGCWLRRGKCERSEDGPCNNCNEILKRYAHHTSVPKFTCNVQTKISDMKILFPEHAAPTQNPFPNLTILEFHKLLEPIRNILDVIEPQHPRQMWSENHDLPPLPLSPPFWLSYGFSMDRWRKVILSLSPSLEYNINTIDCFFKRMMDIVFGPLENVARVNKIIAICIFNVLYEGIHALETRSAMEKHARDHFLSALEARISCLYCILMPAPAGVKRRKPPGKQGGSIALMCAAFQMTSALLPSGYQDCLSAINDTFVEEAQKGSLGHYQGMSSSTNQPTSGESRSYPNLSKFVPPRFLAIFGVNVETLSSIPPDVKDESYRRLFGICEIMISSAYDGRNGTEIFATLSPHALSIIARTILEHIFAEKVVIGTRCWTRQETMFAIIVLSIIVCNRFVCSMAELPFEVFDKWAHSYPHMSPALYAWVGKKHNVNTICEGIQCISMLIATTLPEYGERLFAILCGCDSDPRT